MALNFSRFGSFKINIGLFYFQGKGEYRESLFFFFLNYIRGLVSRWNVRKPCKKARKKLERALLTRGHFRYSVFVRGRKLFADFSKGTTAFAVLDESCKHRIPRINLMRTSNANKLCERFERSPIASVLLRIFNTKQEILRVLCILQRK